MGKWNESAANFEKAQVLDPNSVLPLNQVVYNYEVLHDWNGARRTIERGLKLDPASRPLFWGLSSDIAIAQRGDLSVADKALEEIGRAPAEVRQSPETITIRAGLYMVRRKWAEALRDWESLGDRLIPSQVGTLGQRYAAIGICKRETGDTNGAHAAFFKACEWYKRDIAPLALQVRARYPVSLALLGEKEAALSEAKRTVEMLPESADALSGLGATTALAQVYALTGEPDRAVDLLAHLLEVPSEITPWVLKVSPDWDPLRGNPRFEELVARAR